ncbi:MAG: hypothetical protein HY704_14115 [Gemmatimonadetes bacterium]|nr:hypothetical protein [Gemmatimonadota bacterium]
MNRFQRNRREVLLPAAALTALRHGLRAEAGPLVAAHALHAAGYAAGDSLFDLFAISLDRPVGELGARRFWLQLSDFLARRGWGSLAHREVGSALGTVTSSDWVEAESSGGEQQPSCHFTMGLLANLLGRGGGGEVSVLEVQCRARGDPECCFAFGSEAAVHALYGRLLDGAPFEEAASSL